MPRTPRPWFSAEKGWWMVHLGGKKIRLARGKATKPEAERRFRAEAAALPPRAVLPADTPWSGDGRNGLRKMSRSKSPCSSGHAVGVGCGAYSAPKARRRD